MIDVIMAHSPKTKTVDYFSPLVVAILENSVFEVASRLFLRRVPEHLSESERLFFEW
jgi:hypothetical protein